MSDSPLKLIGTDGSRYYAWDLKPGKLLVGRKPEADICIPDKTVSRNHAELDISGNGGGCSVLDLESHNGTAVNGTRISSRVMLKAGDTLSFGQTEFRLSSGEDSTRMGSSTTPKLSNTDLDKSVVLSLNEVLKPLPTKVTDLPELFPTLSEMARMLVLPEPKEVMLQRSLALVAKVIPAERLAVLFTQEDGTNIYVAASLLPSGKDPGTFTLSRTIINEILTNKSAVLMGDPTEDNRFAEQKSIVQLELKSAMAVPLFDEGKVLGILYVDTTNPMHRYSNDYLRLLATFGNIIASRLLNYSLLQERQEKQVLDAELKRAASIQQKLLVKESPLIVGYQVHAFQEPCLTVGGDLYDMASLPDGRLLFLVGDVSGKGMGAALLMSNILASFRILYQDPKFDLVRAVSQVSLQLYAYSDPSDFATLFIGLINPATNQIDFINAGHNSPLIIRKNGAREYLEPSGTMIGAFDFSAWTEQNITLLEDDLLFIYSDGVTEAQHGELQFGEERMEQHLDNLRHFESEQISGRLMKEIESFVGDSPRSDDITMLVIKRGK
ncbi:MAG: SpoIIE family protein phosphatase [candidate division Zixibacteria bacterium]|nr:SpoIIE family protein phosphatase [candidate division Zixibacteria bacterium]